MAPAHNSPAAYVASDAYDAGHGCVLTPGVELTVTGVRGRVRFIQHVTGPAGAEWLDVITVRSGHAGSIRPDTVRTVHRSGRARS